MHGRAVAGGEGGQPVPEALGAHRAGELRDEHADVDLAEAVRLCIALTGSEPAARRPHLPMPTDDPLTSREREIALLVADGLSNRDIGERLGISRRTVDGHVERMLRKLAFTSRSQIASWMSSRSV